MKTFYLILVSIVLLSEPDYKSYTAYLENQRSRMLEIDIKRREYMDSLRISDAVRLNKLKGTKQ